MDIGMWISWKKMDHLFLVEEGCVGHWYPLSSGNCVCVCVCVFMCGAVAPSHRRVYWWTKRFNREHETVMEGISPDCPPTAYTSSAVQHVFHIIMVDRHVTIDDLQLATFLCHATIHAVVHRLDEEDLCTLSSKGSNAQTTEEKGAELAGAAHFSQRGPRDFLYLTGYWWWVLVSQSNSRGE